MRMDLQKYRSSGSFNEKKTKRRVWKSASHYQNKKWDFIWYFCLTIHKAPVNSRKVLESIAEQNKVNKKLKVDGIWQDFVVELGPKYEDYESDTFFSSSEKLRLISWKLETLRQPTSVEFGDITIRPENYVGSTMFCASFNLIFFQISSSSEIKGSHRWDLILPRGKRNWNR